VTDNTEPSSKALDATEELGNQGATARRITLDFIKSQIGHFWFTTGDRCIAERSKILAHEPLTRLTLCFIVMKSGFIIIGKSAPLSAENFDPEKGRTFAWEDGIRQLWPMFAFHWLQRDHTAGVDV
jgi:hypothetical protein